MAERILLSEDDITKTQADLESLIDITRRALAQIQDEYGGQEKNMLDVTKSELTLRYFLNGLRDDYCGAGRKRLAEIALTQRADKARNDNLEPEDVQ